MTVLVFTSLIATDVIAMETGLRWTVRYRENEITWLFKDGELPSYEPTWLPDGYVLAFTSNWVKSYRFALDGSMKEPQPIESKGGHLYHCGDVFLTLMNGAQEGGYNGFDFSYWGWDMETDTIQAYGAFPYPGAPAYSQELFRDAGWALPLSWTVALYYGANLIVLLTVGKVCFFLSSRCTRNRDAVLLCCAVILIPVALAAIGSAVEEYLSFLLHREIELRGNQYPSDNSGSLTPNGSRPDSRTW